MERVKVPKEKQIIYFQALENNSLCKILAGMSVDFKDCTHEEIREIVEKDKQRLSDAIYLTKTQKTADILKDAIGKKDKDFYKVANNISYDHKALLLTSDPFLVSDWLFAAGFVKGSVVPSVNVAKRLEKRYSIVCPVAIWKAEIEVPNLDRDFQNQHSIYRQIELFLPSPESGKWNKDIITKEQSREYETHTAFTVNASANYYEVIDCLLAAGLSLDGEMTVNRIENSSTQYFINSKNSKRIELIRYGLFS